MLEILFGLLPLIFVCSAIGVILLNFEAVAMYIVYVLSMLFRPKELLTASSLTPAESTTKVRFSPFTPFIRLWTLFRVLFFPDIELSGIFTKKNIPQSEEASFLSQNAAKTAAKFQIKTYSAINEKDHTSFRNSYEPIVGPNISSEFKKAFPQLSQKALPPEPEPIVLPVSEPVAAETPPKPQINEPISMPIPPIEQPEKSEVILPTTTGSFSNEMPIAQQQPTSTVQAPTPMPEPAPSPTQNKKSEFDAIAALEAKVNQLKETQIKSAPAINPTGISRSIVSSDQAILPTSESKLNLDMSKIHAPIDVPPPPPPPPRPSTEAITKNMKTFTTGGVAGGMSTVLPLVTKIIVYGLLSSPLLIVIGSIIMYMAAVRFDFGQVGNYPKWVSNGIENFVKNNVISETKENN